MELEKLKDTLKLPNLVIIQSKYKKQLQKHKFQNRYKNHFCNSDRSDSSITCSLTGSQEWSIHS